MRIIKMFKILLIVALIFNISFSSFCDESMIDDAAFVTKQEFDLIISDFNSRLSTFEAGINSKIDSQVTSFLDRNGIWNNAPQPVMIEKYVISTSYHNTNWNKYWNSNDEIPYGNSFIVGNINKSGLAVVGYDYSSVNYWNYRNNYSNCYCAAIDRFAYWYDAWYQFDSVQSFTWDTLISQKGGELKARNIISQHNQIEYMNITSDGFKDVATGGSYYDVVWGCDVPELHCLRYFFVEKGKALLWRFAAATGGFQLSETSPKSHENNGDASAYNFTVDIY